MKPTTEKPFAFADFQSQLVKLTESEIAYVLVGGLAVAAWAEAHLTPDESELFDLPLYSKDIDLRGGKPASLFMAQAIHADGAEIGGIVTATRKAAPHLGRIFAVSAIWHGQRTSIEVLERLPGLDTNINAPPNGTPVTAPDGISLLDPCSLFICKLNVANGRTGDAGNNDIKHLAILARVIPRFLDKVRVTALPEYDAREDAQRLLDLLDDCIAQRQPLKIPLPAQDQQALLNALHLHLGAPE